jgi:hypothetical protein
MHTDAKSALPTGQTLLRCPFKPQLGYNIRAARHFGVLRKLFAHLHRCA